MARKTERIELDSLRIATCVCVDMIPTKFVKKKEEGRFDQTGWKVCAVIYSTKKNSAERECFDLFTFQCLLVVHCYLLCYRWTLVSSTDTVTALTEPEKQVSRLTGLVRWRCLTSKFLSFFFRMKQRERRRRNIGMKMKEVDARA